MTAYLAPGMMTPEEIIADVFGTTVAEMGNDGRDNYIVKVRRKRNQVEACQVAMWYYCVKVGLTLQTAAKKFNKHHSTAAYSVKMVYDLMDSDKRFKDRVQECLYRIKKNQVKSTIY